MSPYIFSGLFVTAFIGFILTGILRNKASTAIIKCSACRQNMKRVQYNYPIKTDKSLFLGTPSMEGENGRIYMEYRTGDGGSATHWYRVMQELMICKKCERYIVIQEKKMIFVGNTKAEVERREKKMQRTRQSITGKKFKIEK